MKTKDLLNTVKKAKKVIKKNNTLPVLDNFLFQDGYLIASDLDIFYKVKVDVKENFLIECKFLFDILRKLDPCDDVNFSVNEGRIHILVDGVKKFSLPAENIDNFIKPAEGKFKKIFVLPDVDILTIKDAVKFIADDELRPGMNCVFVSDHIVASDAHKLVKFKLLGERDKKAEVMIPKNVVNLLEAFDINKSNLCWIVEKTEKHIRFINDIGDNHEIITYRNPEQDGKYPAWESIIPKDFYLKFHVDRDSLIRQTELAMIAANQASYLIRLKINKSNPARLIISSNDLDFELGFETELPCEVVQFHPELPEFEIGFKATFLLELIKDIKDHILTFEMSDPSKAALINDDYLLMPMMING